ncbi:NAC domain-containing protein 2-like, partial [Olea europaea var. sylvestris]|uniref:NAC domain-containing protein 2-like n=1 Tax=Olea europaea var. sylvestris TaxID=158386 RepID=UPI000C1D78A7
FPRVIWFAAYTPARENEWYFFTPRKRKYKNGHRPNRGADKGYWKATGADRQIKRNGEIIGYQKALVFYEGKPPNGTKTSWIMQEYRVNNPPPLQQKGADDMRLDDWVLCKVYNKEGILNATQKRVRISKNQIQEPNNTTDQAAAMQEKTDHTLVVHSAPPYNIRNYQIPHNLVYPDVQVVPKYGSANMCSNLEPITTVSPMSSLVPDHSRCVPVSMEQHHEISRIPTMDSDEFLDLESLMNLENEPYDYTLLF